VTDEELIDAALRVSRPEVVDAVAWAYIEAGGRPTIEALLAAARRFGAHPFEVVPWAGFAPPRARSINVWRADAYVDMTEPGAVGLGPQSRSGRLGLGAWLIDTRARVRGVQVH
jgi:hypothetical protein